MFYDGEDIEYITFIRIGGKRCFKKQNKHLDLPKASDPLWRHGRDVVQLVTNYLAES